MSGAQAASGAGAVVRQGYLRKLKTMKKKFFVLRAETVDTSARLEYYESEKKFRAGSAPRRALPLKSCYNITRRLDLKQKHVIALFMREEQFCVVADSEPDLHAWLTSILKQHRNDDASEELLHPIQHVWQVSVQKKGLGASKNIVGLYNLCLTDKTLTLVKIKSQNNVISDLGIPERVEYSLKNIRRCGDSECFFYMEVGRQTSTGAGELWMLSDDSNIAQSMHSTIYHAMRNCAKETENERDHIVMPKGTNENPPPGRRSTYSDGKGRAGLLNEKAVCVGACIRQCVCAACAPDDSAAALAAYTPPAENQAPNNSLTDKEPPPRLIKHHRTVSLPTGCPLFQEPLKIVHERTRSAPLTGEEVDRAILEKAVSHSSCKAVNGTDIFAKKSQWSRRASTGTRLSKLSPAHSKNASTLRNRCDSMPSRASSTFDMERPPPRLADLADMDSCRDEPDSVEWHRTPRIPEEPDLCDTRLRDFSTSLRGSSVQHSRTSSMGVEDGGEGGAMGAGLGLGAVPDGYLPMAPAHETRSGLISASSGSLCSGTPSTDHRFSEYQLDPAMSHIVEYERPPRAYSVGSRPSASESGSSGWRHRAYSVGARQRAAPAPAPARPHPAASSSAPLLPRTPRSSIGDLMELDFSNNSPAAKVIVARTPPTTAGFMERNRPVDEYVDMSPRNAGYVEMRPGDRSLTHGTASAPHAPHAAAVQSPATPLAGSLATPTPSTPEGYVEMNYGRAATRPIAISGARVAAPSASPPEARVCAAGAAGAAGAPPAECRGHRTPLGSGTIFPLSLDSPASPPELDAADIVFDDDVGHHPLTTVREISEEGGRRSAEPPSPACPACPPSPPYARLSRLLPRPGPGPGPRTSPDPPELSCNPLANKNIRMDSETRGACTNQATVVVSGGGAVSRFSAGAGAGARAGEGAPPPPPPLAAAPAPAGDGTAPLNYAALDLEVSRCVSQPAARTYTQIDFARSGDVHLHRAADST